MVTAALFGTSLAQCHSVSWLPGRIFSITQVSMSPVPVCPELSSLPPLRVGTSVRPALVCIRLDNPGSLGSSYLTFGDRNVFWSFASLRALSRGLPFTLLPQLFNFRCRFQNLFLLLLLGHWPETSLLKTATSHL